MAKKPEWDFDATTPVESNRVVPKPEGECLCCGHVHRNKGASILRCWVWIAQPDGTRRSCKCGVYDGLRADSEEKVYGPHWAYGGRVRSATNFFGLHLWHYREGRYTAWSLCGLEADARSVTGHEYDDINKRRCPVCKQQPLAAQVVAPVVLHRVRGVFMGSLAARPRDTGSKLVSIRQRLVWAYRDVKEQPKSAAARAELLRVLQAFCGELKTVLPNIEREIERWAGE